MSGRASHRRHRRPISRRRRSEHHAGSATASPEPRQEWYEARPERLEWELAEFAARGLPAEQEIAQSGQLVIRTALPFKGADQEISVEFPFDYPDVEPRIYGPPLLSRHQNRREGNFCLLEDPTLDWWPGMAAAQLVDEELRWLLEDSEAGPEAVAAGEADMPEPLSQHISASSRRPVLVPDPFWRHEVGRDHGTIALVEKALGSGYVLASAEGFGEASSELVEHFAKSKGERHAGTWTALPDGGLSPWPRHQEILDAIEAANPEALSKLRGRLREDRKRSDVEGWIGATFIEEGPSRGERRRGWAFLRVNLDRRDNRRVTKVSRAFAVTPSERERRIPELVGLARASVLVAGAGSLGAPIVLELAKAGVGQIKVTDFDIYDPNNAVRHVLEPRYAGIPKAFGVEVEAGYLNPFIDLDGRTVRVGGDAADRSTLDAMIEEADVVMDATASQSVTRVLQRRCRDLGKPLVVASLTAGSYGGEVAAFRAAGPCFYCFVLGQEDGAVPKPSEGPRSNVTPVGCSTPAFSGAGFDATALAALAARTVVQASGVSTYPGMEHDYVVVNFRGSDPWRQGALTQHPGCPLCS